MMMNVKHFIRALGTIALLLGLQVVVHAHEYYAKSFVIIHPWAQPSLPNERTARIFMKFDEISEGDRLVSASTALADKVELIGAQEGAISIPKTEKFEFSRDSSHLLLQGLKTQLLEGRSYPVILMFEKSGEIHIMLSIGEH
jgi:periplasmic copper chaperone A